MNPWLAPDESQRTSIGACSGVTGSAARSWSKMS
jgi:hypothetical protein